MDDLELNISGDNIEQTAIAAGILSPASSWRGSSRG